MSTSNLYQLFKTKTTLITEFKNGWGTAPPLWDYLSTKYLKWNKLEWILKDGTGSQPLWDLTINPNIPTCLRITHALCLNNTYCPINKINDLANACQETYTILYKENSVNHWESIANTLKNTKINKKCIGITLSCTSVSDPWEEYDGQQVHNLFKVADLEEK